MVVPRLLLGCVVLATAICSTLASTEDPVLRDLLATYAAQRDGGDYATALKTILQAREHNPWDPALLALLGEAYGNVRDWGRAIWVLRDAIAFGDQRQSTRRNLALALARSGWELWEAEDSAGASIRFRESLGVFPNTAPAQGGMGRLLLDERRLQEALPYLRAAVELEPNDPNYRGDLALCLELLGQVDEALAHLQAAVEAVPENSTNQNDLAWMLFGLGRSQEGLRHAQTAVELEPTDPTLLHTLAAIQLDLGEIEEALLTIQDAARQKPAGPLVRATLGACLARVGRAEEARAELLRAEASTPR